MSTVRDTIFRLDAIDPSRDPEEAHAEADELILAAVDPAIRDAYKRLVNRARWWEVA